MKNRLRILLGSAAIALAIISCNLPARGRTPDTAALPNPTPGIAQTRTPDAQDYSFARLSADDLPPGYRELSEQELQDLGLSTSQFTDAFGQFLSEAHPQNVAAFINTTASLEVVVSVLMAPLTNLEGAAVDLYLRDPLRLANDFAAAGGVADLKMVETASLVGDSSATAAFTLPKSPLPMSGDITVSRHGKAMQIALVFYTSGSQPAINSENVALIVETKLAAID